MSFIENISGDIKKAMLARDKERLQVLRDIKSKLLLEATSGAEGDDASAIKIVMKLHKQRSETAVLYHEQGREDLAKEEEYQASVLAEYLPKMLSEEEIATIVTETIAAVGATGPQDMGKVMGQLTPKLAGKADGKLIAQLVKAGLSK
jgi:uncharacterized protein YqeY